MLCLTDYWDVRTSKSHFKCSHCTMSHPTGWPWQKSFHVFGSCLPLPERNATPSPSVTLHLETPSSADSPQFRARTLSVPQRTALTWWWCTPGSEFLTFWFLYLEPFEWSGRFQILFSLAGIERCGDGTFGWKIRTFFKKHTIIPTVLPREIMQKTDWAEDNH